MIYMSQTNNEYHYLLSTLESHYLNVFIIKRFESTHDSFPDKFDQFILCYFDGRKNLVASCCSNAYLCDMMKRLT